MRMSVCLSGGEIRGKVNQREGVNSEEAYSAYRMSYNSNRILNVGIVVTGTSNNVLFNKACASTVKGKVDTEISARMLSAVNRIAHAGCAIEHT